MSKQWLDLSSMVVVCSRLVVPVIILGLLSACSSTSKQDQEKEHSIFYPALPEDPRIQFLISFNGANRQKIKKGGFADFILGDPGAEDYDIGGIIKAYGVAMYDNRLYVVDLRAPGYLVLSIDDKIIKTVTGNGAGRLIKPINITIDTDGTKYVTDTGRSKVMVFDKNDNFIRSIGNKDTMRPSDVVILNDRLYVSDLKNHTIHVLDKRTGGKYFKFGSDGSSDEQFMFPTNMASTLDGNIYVSDTGNFSVKKYSRSGQFIDKLGTVGDTVGSFARPKGVAVDRKGRIYVVDAAFENVQVFDKDKQVLIYFGEPGFLPGNINLPTDIEIDYDHVELFQKYAKPGFKIKYLIFVTSQFGPFKVNVYGFGELDIEKYEKGASMN